MPEMLLCAVSLCRRPTSRRCGACRQLPLCSLACAQAAWPEHRSSCLGAPEKRKDERGDWQPVPEPLLAVEAPEQVRFEGEEEKTAPFLAVLPHAGAGKAPVEEAEKKELSALICAYPPCDLPRIGFCTRCLLVGWCSVEHQKAHWKAGHKAACAPAETRLVPVLSWEQRIMAEAKAAAPSSLAAMAKLSPIADWDVSRDGAPPTAILKAWRKAAAGGHALAQGILGNCYLNGKGVTKDAMFAVNLFAQAAAQGNVHAQFNLGVCYERGDGIVKNSKLAVEWYAKAAAQDYHEAQNNLGVCYMSGKGVAEDYTVAAGWFAKGAAQGHAQSQHNLGMCYAYGVGVAINLELAASWRAAAKAAAMQPHAARSSSHEVLLPIRVVCKMPSPENSVNH